MRRQITLSMILFLLFFVKAYPAYLNFEPVSVTQPDGSVYNIFASGDEFYNWLHDKDGYTIVQNDKGYYVYAFLKNGDLVPSVSILGKSSPLELGVNKWLKIPDSKIREIVSEFKEKHTHPKSLTGKKEENLQVAKTGVIKNLVVFIRFAGESEFTDNTSVYDNLFNAASGNSLINYFKEVSYNQLTVNSSFYPVPSGTTVLSYQDNYARGYYQPYSSSNTIGYTGGNNGTQRRDREHTLLVNAVNYISSQVPADLIIDNDNDQNVDNVCFIVSGSTSGWNSLLWPHRWELYSQFVYIKGKRVYDYNFQIRSSTLSNGVGVLCHEMFHSLGAPDLYHYTSNGIQPVYQWDIMESNLNPPQHMCTFMKWRYAGWIPNLVEISSSGVYTLEPITSQTNNCFKIRSPNSTTEYFMVEFRKKSGTFESSVPGSGLIVYRINTAVDGRGNSNGPPDEVYIYRPNGTTSSNGLPSNAFFSSESGRIAINNTTNPSGFLANGSAGYIDISQVGSSAGNNITFRVNFQNPNLPTLVSPANGAVDVSLTPTYTWNAFSGALSYSLQVSSRSDFASTVINQSGITATSYPGTAPLESGTTYYWRVNARLNSGTTDWSNVFSFTTVTGISIDSLIGKMCAGSYISINYTANSTFEGGNQFNAELSDTLGKFVIPTGIGYVISTTSGTITARIPDTVSDGTKYRIRIISTLPPTVGLDNGKNISISALLNPFMVGDTAGCLGKLSKYRTSSVTGVTNEWRIKGGTIIKGTIYTPEIEIKWDTLGQQKISLLKVSSFGCMDSVIRYINIYDSPTPSITGDSVVCEYSSGIYSPNTNQDVENKWSITGGKITSFLPNGFVKVAWDSGGSGKVTLNQKSLLSGCETVTEKNVIIVQKPNPGSIIGVFTVCENSEEVYFVPQKTGNTNLWLVTGGWIVGPSDKDTVKIKWGKGGFGNLKLIQAVQSSIACKDTVVQNISINSLPELTITGNFATCENKEEQYSVVSDRDVSTKWHVAGGTINGSDTDVVVKVIWSNPGNWSISVERRSLVTGCQGSSTNETVIITTPGKPVITRKTNDLESSSDQGNQWFFENNIIPGALNKIYTPLQNGNYKVQVTLTGCSSPMSDEFNFVKSGIQENYFSNISYRIYQNHPGNDIIIEFSGLQESELKIKIYSIIGETVFSNESEAHEKGTIQIKIPDNYPAGVYFLEMMISDKIFRSKVFKL